MTGSSRLSTKPLLVLRKTSMLLRLHCNGKQNGIRTISAPQMPPLMASQRALRQAAFETCASWTWTPASGRSHTCRACNTASTARLAFPISASSSCRHRIDSLQSKLVWRSDSTDSFMRFWLNSLNLEFSSNQGWQGG